MCNYGEKFLRNLTCTFSNLLGISKEELSIRNIRKDNNMIGDYYELIIKNIMKIVSKEFKKNKVKVTNGHIYDKNPNSSNDAKISKQQDCMITINKPIKFKIKTEYEGYIIDDVCATIEVKKSINKFDDFRVSMNNVKSVAELVDKNKDANNIKYHHHIDCTDYHKEMSIQYNKPTSIVFGFDGVKKENTLRNFFLNYFEDNELKLHAIPDLFICENNMLLKLADFYVFPEQDNTVDFVRSANSLSIESKLYLMYIHVIYAILKKLNAQKLKNKIEKYIMFKSFKLNELLIIDYKNKKNNINIKAELINSNIKISNIIKIPRKYHQSVLDAYDGCVCENSEYLRDKEIIKNYQGTFALNKNCFIVQAKSIHVVFYK